MLSRDPIDRLETVVHSENLDQKLWTSIHQIQNALSMNDHELAEALELTNREFQKSKLNLNSPSIRHVSNLASHLELNLESLFSGNIDFKCLAQRFYGDRSEAIPEQYIQDAKSKRRTVLSILNYIESILGYSKRAMVLKQFQLNEAVFMKPNESIHLNLALDIANYLYNINKNESILYNMGTFSILNYKNTNITESIDEAKNSVEAYERMFCDISPRYLEKNYRWEIASVKNNLMVIKGHPNEQLRQEIKKNPIKHYLGCIIRSGFIGGMANYLNNHPKQVIKYQCVSKGDPFCSYHVEICEKIN